MGKLQPMMVKYGLQKKKKKKKKYVSKKHREYEIPDKWNNRPCKLWKQQAVEFHT